MGCGPTKVSRSPGDDRVGTKLGRRCSNLGAHTAKLVRQARLLVLDGRKPRTRIHRVCLTVPAETDRAVGDLAGRQHGVVARRQLLENGLSGDAVAFRIAHGWLRPVHRGVYAVGRETLDDRGRWMAAVLALGGGDEARMTLLSHRSAAALFGLLPTQDRRAVQVTTAFSRTSRPGVRSHRSRRIGEIGTQRDGIPCTTVARTLVDLAGAGNAEAFERAWSAGASRRLLRPRQIEREVRAAPYRRGVGLVREALARDRRYLGQRTRSELERIGLRMFQDFGLPRPYANRLLQIGGQTFEADLLWPEARLVVEVDGDETHGNAVARRSDRQRDLVLQLAGWRTIRIGWSELTGEQSAVAEQLHAALAQPPLVPATRGSGVGHPVAVRPASGRG